MKATFSSNDLIRFEKESKIVKADAIVIDATEVIELVKCDEELNNQVKATIHADVFEGGSVILPKEVFPLLKKDHPVTISDSQIIIGSRVININLQPGEGYPRIAGEFNNNIFELTDKEVKQLLEVEHAICCDKTKPILNGIRIDRNRFIAIDDHVFSERVGNFNSEIPVTIGNYKMLKALKGDIKATTDGKYIKYQIGDYKYYDKLMEGEFVRVDTLKPKDYNCVISVDKQAMLGVLKSMEKICSNHKHRLVTLEIFENLIEISARNEVMEVKDLVGCTSITHDELKIGVNCNYLINAIKDMGDKFTMSFTTNVNPIIIESPGKYELVLPVRIMEV